MRAREISGPGHQTRGMPMPGEGKGKGEGGGGTMQYYVIPVGDR